MRKSFFLLLCCVFILATTTLAQAPEPGSPSRQDSLKGSITPERKWWDVQRYDLTIRPDYSAKTISGCNTIGYKVVEAVYSKWMQIDLQDPLVIDSAVVYRKKLPVKKEGDVWFIQMPWQKANSIQTISIYYSGKPKESVHAPWDGGLIWTKDSLGRPWMAVACQLVGASVWYPCKVHQSDEPDKGATISLIVPDTLTGVSNGRLQSKTHHPDGTTTYRWAVVNPINNYGITYYIGKYELLTDTLRGEKGLLDIQYWVLDYNREKARAYMSGEVRRTLRAFEYWFGPYPFYEDGFKMVEAPYIGMEHQGAVGYGNHFMLGRYGSKRLTYWDRKVDRMISHENAHEWFGNSITAADPADRWLQEGFAGYAEELIIESFYGKAAAEEFFYGRSRYGTDTVTAGDKPLISAYGIFKDAGDQMYMQGWGLIHMIRAMIHDDKKFREMLRGLNREFYHQTVTSKQIENYISMALGKDFSPIFDQYLRAPGLPVLEYRRQGGVMRYRLANSIPGLTIPLKTNWTKDQWIDASSTWKEIVPDSSVHEPLRIDRDFYLNTATFIFPSSTFEPFE